MQRFLLQTILFLATAVPLVGQSVRYSQDILVPGRNMLVIEAPAGIESIRVTTTPTVIGNDTLVSGCPGTIVLPLTVTSDTVQGTVTITTYLCDGRVSTDVLPTENWTIRHEYAGPIMVNRDTCIDARVESSRARYLDTIVSPNPAVTVNVRGVRGPRGYLIRAGIPFHYQICYEPRRVELLVDTVYLFFEHPGSHPSIARYVIRKPVTLEAVAPPPPPEPDTPEISLLPPLEDPTEFRNVLAPSGKMIGSRRAFLGSYGVVGALAGYGATDWLDVFAGGILVPPFIGHLTVGAVGIRLGSLDLGPMEFSGGSFVAWSSAPDSDIRTIAPYAVAPWDGGPARATVALSRAFKRHTIPVEVFDREAWTLVFGGDYRIARGWKLATEVALIETAEVLPLLLTARHFDRRWAFDFGLGFDLESSADVFFTSGLSGEIESLPLAPFLSFLYTFN